MTRDLYFIMGEIVEADAGPGETVQVTGRTDQEREERGKEREKDTEGPLPPAAGTNSSYLSC